MKVFVDASFLIAARIQPGGDFNRVLAVGHDSLVTSDHVLEEVARNLKRQGRKPEEFIARLRGFMAIAEKFEILPVGLPLEGSGDRQALAEAVGAECDAFVTSDAHFAPLFGERIKGVLVMKSGAYARQVLRRDPRTTGEVTESLE